MYSQLRRVHNQDIVDKRVIFFSKARQWKLVQTSSLCFHKIHSFVCFNPTHTSSHRIAFPCAVWPIDRSRTQRGIPVYDTDFFGRFWVIVRLKIHSSTTAEHCPPPLVFVGAAQTWDHLHNWDPNPYPYIHVYNREGSWIRIRFDHINRLTTEKFKIRSTHILRIGWRYFTIYINILI